MLSPHISSAFAQERQARYRREAAERRLAGAGPARADRRRTRPHRDRRSADPRAPRLRAVAGPLTRRSVP